MSLPFVVQCCLTVLKSYPIYYLSLIVRNIIAEKSRQKEANLILCSSLGLK